MMIFFVQDWGEINEFVVCRAENAKMPPCGSEVSLNLQGGRKPENNMLDFVLQNFIRIIRPQLALKHHCLNGVVHTFGWILMFFK